MKRGERGKDKAKRKRICKVSKAHNIVKTMGYENTAEYVAKNGYIQFLQQIKPIL